MSETVKEIEVTKSFSDDNWYAKCIGQKFAVMDPTWWSLAEGDCYYVEHPENDEDTVFYVLKKDCKVTKSVARSAPETTASPSETAADKGILTEEELSHRSEQFHTDYMGGIMTPTSFRYTDELMASHIAIQERNRNLVLENDELNAENMVYKDAMEKCNTGCNSLASVLIGLKLPVGWHDWTYEESSKYFYEHFEKGQAYEYYEVWLCWASIREANEALEELK